MDRLTRSPRELEDVIDLHDRHGVQLATCGGEIDLSTPTGRLIARTLGAAARHEAEHKGERQRRQSRQAAGQGRAHGARGYGHTRDRAQVIEAEAQVIRECARRALAGESVKGLAVALNDQGILTITGRQWTRQALRAVLISARISGRREYRPTDSYEPGHRPLTGPITAAGMWPQIVSPEDSDRLRALLGDSSRLRPANRSYRYLLSGVFRCGVCGTPIRGRAHAGRARYQCVKQPGRPGCGKIAVFADLAEAEARDKILTALNESPGLLGVLLAKQQAAAAGADRDDPGARLRAIDERRDELAAAWAAGEISRKEWATAKRVLDGQASQIESRINRSARARALAEFAALTGDMWQRWEDPAMTTSARRALIEACVIAIDVRPAAPGKRWDADRIQPVWIA